LQSSSRSRGAKISESGARDQSEQRGATARPSDQPAVNESDAPALQPPVQGVRHQAGHHQGEDGPDERRGLGVGGSR